MIVGRKSSPAPPCASDPLSIPFGDARSSPAQTLLPRVMVYSAPWALFVSCQPWGDAVAFAGWLIVIRASAGGSGLVWCGLSMGIG